MCISTSDEDIVDCRYFAEERYLASSLLVD